MSEPGQRRVSMKGMWHTYGELEVLLRYLDEWFLVRALGSELGTLQRAREARRGLQTFINAHRRKLDEPIESGAKFNELVTALDSALRALDPAAATHPPLAGAVPSHDPPGAMRGAVGVSLGATHGYYYLDC